MIKSFYNLTQKERKAAVYFMLFLCLSVGVKFIFFENIEEDSELKEGIVKPLLYNHTTTKNKTKTSRSEAIEKSLYKKKDNESRVGLVFPDSLIEVTKLGQSEWEKIGFSKAKAKGLTSFFSYKGWVSNASEIDVVYVLSADEKASLISHTHFELKDLNQLSERDFRTIKGVGDVLSKRIVAYRKKLGGFYSDKQLKEVYGLDSVTAINVLKKTRLESGVFPLLINQLSFFDLKNHPYIELDEAKNIIAMRSESPIKNIHEVGLVVKDSIRLNKLQHYLKYE